MIWSQKTAGHAFQEVVNGNGGGGGNRGHNTSEKSVLAHPRTFWVTNLQVQWWCIQVSEKKKKKSDDGKKERKTNGITPYRMLFRVFDLAAPVMILLLIASYVGSKPYILNVDELQRMTKTNKKATMADMIWLSWWRWTVIILVSNSYGIIWMDPDHLPHPLVCTNKVIYYVDIKLQGGAPGKMMADQKARLFLDRLEYYYVRHPDDLII